MVSTFRQGITAYGLALLVGPIPGLLGVVVGGNLLGWSSIAQDAMFGIGLSAFLIIWGVVVMYGEPPITKIVWRLWIIAGVGIFAGVYCFVEANKSASGSVGQLSLRVLGALLVAVPSVLPILRFARIQRKRRPTSPEHPAVEVGSAP